jgi:large subunit ribosomal protein L27
MAHKKAAGSKATQGSNVAGKRRGIKAYSGEKVTVGAIIIRQKGTLFHPGVGVGMGRDFTIFAKEAGIVRYDSKLGRRTVNVDGRRSR